MKKSLLLITFAVLIVCSLWHFQPKNVQGIRVKAQAVLSKGFPFDAFTPVMQHIMTNDQQIINYDSLIKDPQPLRTYLALIAEVGPRSAPHRFTRREERLAYALNAYQAGLLAVIIQHCPLTSLADPYWFNGIFWRVSIRVDGQEMSINDLAAQVSALAMGDSRVYLTLNKGIRSGIPMFRQAWTPYNLEKGLTYLEKQLLQHGPWLTFDTAQGILSLSGPFKWYELMFTPSPLKYLQKHKPMYQKGVKQVLSHPIDWRLQGKCTQHL